MKIFVDRMSLIIDSINLVEDSVEIFHDSVKILYNSVSVAHDFFHVFNVSADYLQLLVWSWSKLKLETSWDFMT